MRTISPVQSRLHVAATAKSPSPTTSAFSGSDTDEGRQSIRPPTLAEYRRLHDDPAIQWLFDEDGFPIAGVARAKPNTTLGEEGAPKAT